MIGDAEALKYARRDLPTLDAATRLAPGRRVAVQAGGNLGVFAARLAENFGAVYCFEPDPTLFRRLAANVPDPNVVLLQAALGSTIGLVGTSRTRRTKTHLPPHDGVTHVSGPGVVPVLMVDMIGLDACDLFVLDVEGMELSALHGAQDTLERHRPVVMVEINDNCQHYGVTQDDVRTFLRICDYELHSRVHSDEIWVPIKGDAR